MNIRTEYRCNHCNGEFPKVARVGLQCDETLRGLDDRRICEACFDYLLARPDLNDSERTQLQSAGRIAESYDSSIKGGSNPDTGERFESYGHQVDFLEEGLKELHGEGSHKGDFIVACPTCRDEELDLIAEEDKNTDPYTGETSTEVQEEREEEAAQLRRSGDYYGAAAIEGEPNAFTEMADEMNKRRTDLEEALAERAAREEERAERAVRVQKAADLLRSDTAELARKVAARHQLELDRLAAGKAYDKIQERLREADKAVARNRAALREREAILIKEARED